MASNQVHGASGQVFLREGRLLRAVDALCHSALDDLANGGLLEQFMRERKVVATRFVDEPARRALLAGEHPGYTHFLEHELLPLISFPSEWSVSMLADAATLTLELQMALLDQAFSLKDASAWHIQFRDARPIFTALSSIERPRRLDAWPALGQFRSQFLFPLLLARHRGWDLRASFLTNPDGPTPAQVAGAFRGAGQLCPVVFRNVTLPRLLEARAAAKEDGKQKGAVKSGGRAEVQLAALRRLRKEVQGLAGGCRPKGSRSGGDAGSGTSTGEAAKTKMVGVFLGETSPRTVLDLGCGSGDFSFMAAEAGARVVAVDKDADAVESLYRRVRSNPAKITPLVCDLANPTPATGFLNRERAGFIERFAGAGECVLALGLFHHLLASDHLSLEQICELLACLTGRWLVLEYVPPGEGEFGRPAQDRANRFSGLTLNACLGAFSGRFDLLSRQALPGTERTLLFLEKRQG